MVETRDGTAAETATTIPAVSRPRARLGETQIVQLPNSDSEDEGDREENRSGDEAGTTDANFLTQFPDDTEELHLQHLKITNAQVELLNFPRFSKLKRLCLRQNNLTSPLPPTAFEGLHGLEELDFYDNRLGSKLHESEILGCQSIKTLDLSFNNMRHPPYLPSFPHVETLYLVQNKISKVEEGDLDWAAGSMKSLELGGNRLRDIQNIEMLVKMEELWLGKNKIRQLTNLGSFVNLRILSIQSNRITKLEGLDELLNLEELYLSHNGLTVLEGLDKNIKLTTLDVGNNMIQKIENLRHLVNLEEFWASYNKIPDLHALEAELGVLPALETVYLEGNPCQLEDRAGYRRKVILALPKLKQVDATFVKV